MKCDELKAETIAPQGCALTLQMYPKSEVDSAIDELKTSHHKERDEYISMVHSREQTINELKAKLNEAEMRTDLAEAANTEYRIDLKNIKDNLARHARNLYHKYNRQTLKSLWLERARRAEARKDYWYARSCHEGDDFLVSIDGSPVKYIGCIKRTNFDWLKIWSEVECKCLKKAEEYK